MGRVWNIFPCRSARLIELKLHRQLTTTANTGIRVGLVRSGKGAGRIEGGEPRVSRIQEKEVFGWLVN